MTLLMMDYLSSPQVTVLINYLIQAGESADSEAFVRELAQRVPQHGDALMTIAQQLEKKGIEKGILLGKQEGIEEGKLAGKQEGKLEVARTLLAMGMSKETVQKATGLSEQDLEQIKH